MAKRYARLNWKDYPSTNTPRNATNFNVMDKGIDDIDNAIEAVQDQIDELVISGDSSVEAAQARVSSGGTTYNTLKQRLDTEHTEVTSSLAQIENQKADEVDLAIERERINGIVTSAGDYYVKCLSTDQWALLVVTSGATTGQINISMVTPKLDNYTPVAGDYVRLVSNGLTAETIDIRIDGNGKIHDTAGNAVRDQIAKLSEEYTKKSIVLNQYLKRTEPTIIDNNNGAISINGNITTGTGYSKSCNVIKGQTYEILGYQFSLSYPSVVYLLSNGTYARASECDLIADNTRTNHLLVTIPSNAVKIYVTGFNAAQCHFYQLDVGKYVDNYLEKPVEKIPIPFDTVSSAYFSVSTYAAVSASEFNYALVNVSEGEKYHIKGRGNVSAYPYAVFNPSHVVIDRTDINTSAYTTIDTIIEIPAGGTALVVNAETSVSIVIEKLKYIEYWDYVSIQKKYISVTPTIDISGVMSINHNIATGTGINASVNVSYGEVFNISGYKYSSGYPMYLYLKNGSIVSYETDLTILDRHEGIIVTIPKGVDTLVVNSNNQSNLDILKMSISSDKIISPINGKKIAWFGTSIPSGYPKGKSYPQIIAEKSGSIVYNESVASSCARLGYPSKVTSENPYGWKDVAWQNIAYSLGASLSEKNYLIDNWDTFKIVLSNTPPASLDDNAKEYIRNCSYERKLDKYLSGGAVGVCDLYVFNHGYNDLQISGEELNIVPSDINDRMYFIGVMHFLINRILTSNPQAKICIISHYENQQKLAVNTSLNTISQYYGFPYCEQWRKSGVSQATITTTGYWDANNHWISSGGTSTNKTIQQCLMPDDIHPNSDTDLVLTKRLANITCDYLESFM